METLFSIRRVSTACLPRLLDTGRSLRPFASTLSPLPFVLVALLSMSPNAAHAFPGLASAQFSGVQSIVGTGLRSPHGIAIDNSGNVYIADSGNGAVKEALAVNGVVPVNPTINTISSFNRPHDIAIDSLGDIYVADTNDNQIKEIVAVDGSIPVNPTVNVIAGTFSFHSPYGVAVDASGNVYVADTGNSAVEEIIGPNNVSPTVKTLGSGFDQPQGVTVDINGNVFVSDTNHSLVKEILAVNGSIPNNPTINTLGSGYASNPVGLAVDAAGNLYIADNVNSAVYELLAVNGTIPTSNPTVISLGSNFSAPYGVAFGPNGLLYVIDDNQTGLDELMPYTANFGSVPVGTTTALLPLTFTFTGAGVFYGDNTLVQGGLGLEFEIRYDGAGSCTPDQTYNVGDTCTVAVEFTPTAIGPRYGVAVLQDAVSNTIATAPLFGIGTGPEVIFSPGTQSTLGSGFNAANAVAVDSKGDLYVADTGNNQVKEVMAVNGSIPANPTINILGSGFSNPMGVAIDGSGNVYVADFGNSAIKEILAVNGSIPPSNPTINTLGTGLAPKGLAVDSRGNVFFAGYNNAVYEMLASSGYTIVNQLGSGFLNPGDVAVDANGDVFVADSNNGYIKEIVSVDGLIPANNPTINILSDNYPSTQGIAVDANSNVYVANGNVVAELVAAGGYTTANTLDSNFSQANGIAVDVKGNVYVADSSTTVLNKLNYSTSPPLTFASTAVGSSSTPQTVTLTNYGNAPLSFPKPSTGLNPAFPAGFTLDSTSSCPRVSPSSSAGSLAANASCTLAIDFAPTTPGVQSGLVSITDNNLNASAPTYTHQVIQVGGTGTGGTNNSKSTPTITVTSSANPVVAGSSVTLTVKLSGTSGTPTGTVEFKDGSTVLATVNLIDGTASFTTTDLAVGTQSITVVYSGDSNFNTVTSSVLSLVVQSGGTPTGIQIGFGSTSYAQTTATGSATYSVNISPVGAFIFNDKVTYTLSGIPAGWTATYSQASIAAGSPDTTVIIHLKQAGSASLLPSMLNGNSIYTVALGLLLLPFTGRLRRISKRWSQLACLLLLVAAGAAIATGVTGCGGATSPPSTTYTMTLTATSGSLSHSATLNLTVQSPQ